MAQRVHSRRPRARTLVSVILVSLCLGLISSSLASPLPSIHLTGDALVRVAQIVVDRRAPPWLERRAPTPVLLGPSPGETPSEGGGGVGSTTTTTDPPVQTTTTIPPPVSTISTKDLPLPVTTTITTTATTTTPETSVTTTTTPATTSSSKDPDTTSTTTSHSQQPRPSTDRPRGTGSKGPSIVTTTSSTSTPSATPFNPSDSNKPPILPIVLGSILGAGALIGAAVFFFLRFRKHKRFDSKRPLSFLALSADDLSTGTESASARAPGTDALYDTHRPITSQPSLRYSPPVMSGINRYSYQSSEHSGVTGSQLAQWSQDDENAALVGGPSRQQQLMMAEQGEDGYPARFHEHLPMADSEQPFVASSMIPLARNDPRHARYSQQQQQQQQHQPEIPEARNENHPSGVPPALSQRGAPLQVLNPEAEQETSTSRPLSVHSNAASVLSVKNPSVRSEGQAGQSSRQSEAGAIREDDLEFL